MTVKQIQGNKLRRTRNPGDRDCVIIKVTSEHTKLIIDSNHETATWGSLTSPLPQYQSSCSFPALCGAVTLSQTLRSLWLTLCGVHTREQLGGCVYHLNHLYFLCVGHKVSLVCGAQGITFPPFFPFHWGFFVITPKFVLNNSLMVRIVSWQCTDYPAAGLYIKGCQTDNTRLLPLLK